MKIVVQNFKTGVLSVSDAPPPSLSSNGVLVRVHTSLISAGTDRAIIGLGRKSYLGKALDRPDLARKVIDRARTEGLWPTYKVVKNLIAEPIPLGYSLVGTVIAVGRNVNDIAIGDRVAGAGLGHANHAEVVSVPRNLAARVPKAVSDDQAAYVTLGAIAMHGIRQADQQIGATVVVVGLGLVGLVTLQIAAAAGLRAIGVDIDRQKLELARANGATDAFLMSDPALKATLGEMTSGRGADAILLTAGSRKSGAVFEEVAELCRDRARVVVVGDVKMDLSRRSYFEKEIEILQSRSYGPGRYDPEYELEGKDYPIGYVRWTERRNLESYLQLVADGRFDPARLTTHRFPIEKAVEAYSLVTGEAKDEGLNVGILLDFDRTSMIEDTPPVPAVKRAVKADRIGLGLIGAGQFAKGILLPAMMESGAFALRGVSSARGLSAISVAERYGSDYGVSDSDKVLDDDNVTAVLITTRHDSHARYAIAALERGKHVFVEKPLALTAGDLAAVEAACRNSAGTLTIGFNRRFSPMVTQAAAHFADRREPLSMLYRVNAGRVPLKSEMGWVHDPTTGGGRIIGEGCHFIDTFQAISGATPVEISAVAANPRRATLSGDDTVSFTIGFDDGSIGTVHYWANGDPSYPKEYMEVFGGERAAILNNFRQLDLVAGGKSKRTKSLSSDKGYNAEARAFAQACRTGEPSIALESLLATTRATFAVKEVLCGLSSSMDTENG